VVWTIFRVHIISALPFETKRRFGNGRPDDVISLWNASHHPDVTVMQGWWSPNRVDTIKYVRRMVIRRSRCWIMGPESWCCLWSRRVGRMQSAVGRHSTSTLITKNYVEDWTAADWCLGQVSVDTATLQQLQRHQNEAAGGTLIVRADHDQQSNGQEWHDLVMLSNTANCRTVSLSLSLSLSLSVHVCARYLQSLQPQQLNCFLSNCAQQCNEGMQIIRLVSYCDLVKRRDNILLQRLAGSWFSC